MLGAGVGGDGAGRSAGGGSSAAWRSADSRTSEVVWTRVRSWRARWSASVASRRASKAPEFMAPGVGLAGVDKDFVFFLGGVASSVSAGSSWTVGQCM